MFNDKPVGSLFEHYRRVRCFCPEQTVSPRSYLLYPLLSDLHELNRMVGDHERSGMYRSRLILRTKELPLLRIEYKSYHNPHDQHNVAFLAKMDTAESGDWDEL